MAILCTLGAGLIGKLFKSPDKEDSKGDSRVTSSSCHPSLLSFGRIRLGVGIGLVCLVVHLALLIRDPVGWPGSSSPS